MNSHYVPVRRRMILNLKEIKLTGTCVNQSVNFFPKLIPVLIQPLQKSKVRLINETSHVWEHYAKCHFHAWFINRSEDYKAGQVGVGKKSVTRCDVEEGPKIRKFSY